MSRWLSDKMFSLKRVGKYITDSELRKAYADYRQSEEIASRLILNTALSEGWLVAGWLTSPSRNASKMLHASTNTPICPSPSGHYHHFVYSADSSVSWLDGIAAYQSSSCL